MTKLQPKDNANYDIIVVGAGIVGAAFALSLAKKMDIAIALVERGSRITNQGVANQRVSALGQVAVKLLRDIDVWNALPETAHHAYQTMYVWDDQSMGDLKFNATDYDATELGHIVDSQACVVALQNAIEQQHNVDVFYQFQAQNLTTSNQQACLTGTQTQEISDKESDYTSDNESDKSQNPKGSRLQTKLNLKAQLIVGADGQQSWVRQQLDIATQKFNYEQQAIVATIATERTHQNTAWQCFLNSGPVAVLPLESGESSIVWSADNALAKELMSLDDTAFMARLSKHVGEHLGHVVSISKRHAFPLQSLKAEHYYVDNVVLLGDAAHSIHPLAGQGANLGFKDAKALVDCLSAIHSSQAGKLNEKRKLRAYERERKLDNETTDVLMTSLHQLFKPDSSLLSHARGSGMMLINKTNKIKQQLAKQAIG